LYVSSVFYRYFQLSCITFLRTEEFLTMVAITREDTSRQSHSVVRIAIILLIKIKEKFSICDL